MLDTNTSTETHHTASLAHSEQQTTSDKKTPIEYIRVLGTSSGGSSYSSRIIKAHLANPEAKIIFIVTKGDSAFRTHRNISREVERFREFVASISGSKKSLEIGVIFGRGVER